MRATALPAKQPARSLTTIKTRGTVQRPKLPTVHESTARRWARRVGLAAKKTPDNGFSVLDQNNADDDDIAKILAGPGLTARQVVDFCRDIWDKRNNGGAVAA